MRFRTALGATCGERRLKSLTACPAVSFVTSANPSSLLHFRFSFYSGAPCTSLSHIRPRAKQLGAAERRPQDSLLPFDSSAEQTSAEEEAIFHGKSTDRLVTELHRRP